MNELKNVGVHFVPADYLTYDFVSLQDELAQNRDTILWYTGTKGGMRAHRFNVGDVCFFYYSNLPDGTSRILLKGVVTESDTDMACISEDRFSYDADTKGFRVGNLRAVALQRPEKFSQYILETSYFGSKEKPKQINQTQRYLNQPGYRTLLEDLLADDDHTTLKGVIKYFDDYLKCFFSGKDHSKHTTFIMAKGVPYTESHHFVKKSYLEQHADMRWLINAPKNLIRLCPTCHAKLHHGKAEDVIRQLDLIYQENRAWYDEKLMPYARRDGFSSVMPWIFDIYNQERQKNHYELIDVTEEAVPV